ncbi:MAG: PSD1 and planctomycete cytochrome C domain-containing protein [Pirellulales bacterium]|nr:PSD1 and planctomycete cytochrome C domain-containing protein [Pirellulales bacterium]
MATSLAHSKLIVAALTLCAVARAADEPSEAEKLFALKVKPLFEAKCMACHGEKPDELEGEFDLRSRAAMLRGGGSFGTKVVVPGNADASKIYAMVRRIEEDFEMPPKEAEKLTWDETVAIRDWINGGAPWPDDARVAEIYKKYADGITWKTSGGLSDAWTNRKYKQEDLWAYQPLRKDAENVLGKTDRNPIDALIEARFEKFGVEAAPPADRRTLIRRATFDLWGLPPESADVEKFVADARSDDDAFRALVDRLLANPHYGEQWGRHWLDVVRYADSAGFANDWEQPNAWRYRDYVIRAFNNDKPYDQFIREQLAGDEIYELKAKDKRLAKDDANLLIAPGMLRMGPWEQTAMSVAKVTRQQFLDDVTDSVGQVFLGHALQCSRCHDHKFDPVPTRDYYAFQAAFATTQFADRDAPWLAAENLRGMDVDRKHLEKRRQVNKPKGRIGSKWAKRFAWELDRYKPIAFSVQSGKTRLRRAVTSRIMPAKEPPVGIPVFTRILAGGDVFSPGVAVMPAVLSAANAPTEAKLPEGFSGRRLALANWIADPQNPLTARVIANRVWQYHFGRGLAGNPTNFGATGKKPTHPKLLDWLAGELIANGWSIKHLHRAIMRSDAYKRSAVHPDAKKFKTNDPAGESYAVFRARRLTAEELRDAMLAASGELNREVGGIPIRPDMNLEAALQPRMIMGGYAPSYVPNAKPAQRNRRSVYVHRTRGQRDPFFETFNQPGFDKSCELRDTSTITPQALTLINSEETNDRALAFAARAIKEADADEYVIRRVFELAYGRQPGSVELREALEFWKRATAIQARTKYKPRTWPTEITREAIDAESGKPFTFKEKLVLYENYVPDLQPHEVDARTRGLADLCLAVFNSNEFAYVD